MSSEIVGSGKYRYRVILDWAKVPLGDSFGLITGGACDDRGHVYVCQRKNPPIVILDSDGLVIGHWGYGKFKRPHGLSIRDDTLYIADDQAHVCSVYGLSGNHILSLGSPGQASDTGYVNNSAPVARSAGPFHRPTKMVKGDEGDLYVSDGYGNARVHRFSESGQLKRSWGFPGSHRGTKDAPGEFHLVHSVLAHGESVYVVDRENERIHICDTEFCFREMWLVPRPLDIVVDSAGVIYVSGRVQGESNSWIWVMDAGGKVLATMESRGGHGIWVDSEGSIYAGLGRHHRSAVPVDVGVADLDYVPPTSFGGQGIVGAIDKFERVH